MIIPHKLQKGDEIRVIAPSNSQSIISYKNVELAKQKLEEAGYIVTFGKHVNESDMFKSSSISSRITDLHEAFLDKNVKAILCTIGGYNANQLLEYIDFDIIKNNPKIFCGYSDITVLQNAFLEKANLVTYSGPCFSTLAMQKEADYNWNSLIESISQEKPYEILESPTYSDDQWYIDQQNRNVKKNEGIWIINKGICSGVIIGGNLNTFNLLQGTQFMPQIKENIILFLEEDYLSNAVTFDRDLQSLIQQKLFSHVKGIVIGRFQEKSEITKEKLEFILKTKKELKYIPIVANVNIGHTNPFATFPIGGECQLQIDNEMTKILITKH